MHLSLTSQIHAHTTWYNICKIVNLFTPIKLWKGWKQEFTVEWRRFSVDVLMSFYWFLRFPTVWRSSSDNSSAFWPCTRGCSLSRLKPQLNSSCPLCNSTWQLQYTNNPCRITVLSSLSGVHWQWSYMETKRKFGSYSGQWNFGLSKQNTWNELFMRKWHLYENEITPVTEISR